MEDESTWRGPLAKIVVAVLRIIWVFVNNVYVIPAYLFYMFLLSPLEHWNPAVYWTIEGVLFRWMTKFVSYWMWTAGYTG